jgi:hypothetical protein
MGEIDNDRDCNACGTDFGAGVTATYAADRPKFACSGAPIEPTGPFIVT